MVRVGSKVRFLPAAPLLPQKTCAFDAGRCRAKFRLNPEHSDNVRGKCGENVSAPFTPHTYTTTPPTSDDRGRFSLGRSVAAAPRPIPTNIGFDERKAIGNRRQFSGMRCAAAHLSKRGPSTAPGPGALCLLLRPARKATRGHWYNSATHCPKFPNGALSLAMALLLRKCSGQAAGPRYGQQSYTVLKSVSPELPALGAGQG